MSTGKMNIILASSEFPPQPGGIGNHAFNLARYLNKNNCKVTVISDQRSYSGIEEKAFDDALDFTIFRIKRWRFRPWMYVKRLVLLFQNYKMATHVIATGKFSIWSVAFCSLFYKKPIYAIIHGTEVNLRSRLLRIAINRSLKRFDKIIAVSNYTKSFVDHINKDIIVIANGIDVSEWQEPKTSKEIKGDPIITTVGRVSSRKGQLNVIKHLPQLIKKFPNLHYHCIGIPTEAEDFLKVARHLNVESCVTFHGSLKQDELKQILVATDIFVMLSSESSTGDVEGFGIAILEANAMGVPAIGSIGCGIEDAINPGYSGILVDVDDTVEFVLSIETIISRLPKYKSGATDWAKSHDWNTIIEQYLKVLK